MFSCFLVEQCWAQFTSKVDFSQFSLKGHPRHERLHHILLTRLPKSHAFSDPLESQTSMAGSTWQALRVKQQFRDSLSFHFLKSSMTTESNSFQVPLHPSRCFWNTVQGNGCHRSQLTQKEWWAVTVLGTHVQTQEPGPTWSHKY